MKIFIKLLLLISFLPAYPQGEVNQIFELGYYHEVPDLDRALNWYALTDDYGKSVLYAADPQILKYGYPSHYFLTTRTKRRSVLLIGTVFTLAEGTVDGHFYRGLSLTPNCNLNIKMAAEEYKLEVTGKVLWQGSDNEAEYSHCKIYLRGKDREQLLAKEFYSYGSEPILVWSGDLDGDGCLDLLVNKICKEERTLTALYVSSLARPRDLVSAVIQAMDN